MDRPRVIGVCIPFAKQPYIYLPMVTHPVLQCARLVLPVWVGSRGRLWVGNSVGNSDAQVGAQPIHRSGGPRAHSLRTGQWRSTKVEGDVLTTRNLVITTP